MNTKTKDPDDLLQNINQSIMIKGLLIATAIHAVIILGTSFGLYRDWGTYGFLATPSTINNEKQKAKRAAEEAERQAMAAQKAAEREADAKIAATNKTSTATSVGATAPTSTDVDQQSTPSQNLDNETLPPAKEFTLDGFGL